MVDPEGMRCEPITDESGEVIAHARVSGDLDGRTLAALINVVNAARRLDAERLASDPEFAERRRRSVERIRERNRRWRGEDRG